MPFNGVICFPTSGVEGVAALYEAFRGSGGQWGYAVTLLVLSIRLPVVWKVRKNSVVAFWLGQKCHCQFSITFFCIQFWKITENVWKLQKRVC